MKKTFILALAFSVSAWPLCVAAGASMFDAFAPPETWSQHHDLPGHLGQVSFVISYEAVGNTVVIGEVTYAGEGGTLVTTQFHKSIAITTGRFAGQPRVRFKGSVLGSAVRVRVAP